MYFTPRNVVEERLSVIPIFSTRIVIMNRKNEHYYFLLPQARSFPPSVWAPPVKRNQLHACFFLRNTIVPPFSLLEFPVSIARSRGPFLRPYCSRLGKKFHLPVWTDNRSTVTAFSSPCAGWSRTPCSSATLKGPSWSPILDPHSAKGNTNLHTKSAHLPAWRAFFFRRDAPQSFLPHHIQMLDYMSLFFDKSPVPAHKNVFNHFSFGLSIWNERV